jgi:hypothetical protein
MKSILTLLALTLCLSTHAEELAPPMPYDANTPPAITTSPEAFTVQFLPFRRPAAACASCNAATGICSEPVAAEPLKTYTSAQPAQGPLLRAGGRLRGVGARAARILTAPFRLLRGC